MSANEVKRPMTKPNYPCPNCKSDDWWWPSDSYLGPKQWLCNRCHPNPNPAPKEVEVINNAPGTTRVHTQYKLKDGTIVPGVTTALGILNKGESLQDWIWECGRQGLDYREVRDAAARIGTLAHYLITCRLKSETPNTSDYSPAELGKARFCLEKYLRWEKEHSLSPVMMETPLVSEAFRYGGTMDLLAEIDGEFALIDFKTGKSIYPGMLYQLAAYWKLLEEQGWPVANARILRIGADEDGDFEEVIRTSLERDWKIFRHCLEIYRLQGER